MDQEALDDVSPAAEPDGFHMPWGSSLLAFVQWVMIVPIFGAFLLDGGTEVSRQMIITVVYLIHLAFFLGLRWKKNRRLTIGDHVWVVGGFTILWITSDVIWDVLNIPRPDPFPRLSRWIFAKVYA